MANIERPVVAIIVTKRNPVASIGRPQKYRWKAVNWANRKPLAVSSEAYTNRVDALAAAVQLFADDSVDQSVIDAARFGQGGRAMFRASNVFLIEDGVTGMQALRLKEPA
jgi:hypothetical protein